MKKIIVVLVLFLICTGTSVFAYSINDVLDKETRDNINNTFEISGVDYNAMEIIDKLNNGNFNYEFTDFFSYIKTLFKDFLKENLGFLSLIFILVMLASAVENLNMSFGENKTLSTVISSLVVISLIDIVKDIAQYSITFIDSLILFINSLIPTLTMLLATSGRTGTAGILNPVMLGVSSIIVYFVKNFVVPLCFISLVLNLTGCITEKNYISTYGGHIHKLIKVSLGVVFTVYVGIIGIIGVAAPKVDEVTLKTTKYAVSNFIPYVGGMVSDSVELILACSGVVKNSVGIAGLIFVLIMSLAPCLRIATKFIMINVLGVLISPVAGKRILDALNNISSTVGILFAMNIVVSIMYIISISVIIFIGGA